MNSIPEMGLSNQLQPRSDFSQQGKVCHDNSKFASIVNQEHAKTGQDSTQSGDVSQVNKEHAKTGQDSTQSGDVSQVNKEHAKTGQSSTQSEDVSHAGASKKESGPEQDSTPCNDCRTDMEPPVKNKVKDEGPQDTQCCESPGEGKEHPGKALKTGALLYSLIHDFIEGTENASGTVPYDIVVPHIEGVEPDGTGAGSGLKIGSVLYDLIQHYAEGLGEGLNPGTVNVQGAGQEVTASADSQPGAGLKAGSVLYDLVQRYAAGLEDGFNPGAGNEQGEGQDSAASDDSQAANGLKVGAILKGLISSYAGGTEDGSQTDAVNEAGTGSGPRPENGLKIGELLNRAAEGFEGKEINQDLIREETAAADKTIVMDAGSDNPEADMLPLEKGMPAAAGTKREVSGQMEKERIEGKVVDADIPDAIKTDSAAGRTISVGSEQAGFGHGTRDYTSYFGKGHHNSGSEAEANNITPPNAAGTTYEGVRSIQTPSMVHTIKTPGVQELLDNVILVIKGNSRMGVSVEHEKLGKLNISLSLEKGMVNVHINTSDRAVREIIENNIQQIIDTLNKDGVSVGEFSVALRDQKEHEINRFTGSSGQNGEVHAETKKEYRHNGLVNIFA